MSYEKRSRNQAEGSPLRADRFRASTNYVLREIAGESVLVSIGSGVADFCGVVVLNPSAKVLWQKLQQGADRAELVQALQVQFDVPEEKASEDVEQALSLLKERGMISCEG